MAEAGTAWKIKTPGEIEETTGETTGETTERREMGGTGTTGVIEIEEITEMIETEETTEMIEETEDEEFVL